MLYSGYFWGFTSPCMVVLELKAMKPPITLLENLIKCFRMQDCGVILITPYLSNYGSMVSTDGDVDDYTFDDYTFDYISGVTYDKYALFISDMVLEILIDAGYSHQVKDKTTVFMDGRIAGFDGVPLSYDMVDTCMYQKGFARLLNYIYYGLTFELDDENNISNIYFDEENFMKPLFIDLWDEYMTSSADLNPEELDYFSSEEIDLNDYIDLWNDRLEAGRGSYHWDYMQDYIYDNNGSLELTHYNAYYAAYQDFYQGIINNLFNRNIHIIAHLGGTKYVDLLSWEVLDSNLITLNTYTFDSSASFGDLYRGYSYLEDYTYSLDYVYGMGIWNLKTQFYDFLKDVQDHWDFVQTEYNILNDFPIYIYEKDPITWGDDGLIIQSNSQMREYWRNLGFYDYGDGTVIDAPSVLEDLETLIMNFFAGL